MINKYLFTHFPKQYGYMMATKSRILLPIKLTLLNLGFNVYFGGKRQDEWIVNEIFNHKRKGYFIDLAATDGILENNTFFLEKKLKWKGICIEPNKSFFKKLKRNRECIVLNQVISDKKKLVKFFEDGGNGGIIGKNYDNNYQKRKKLLKKNDNFHKIKKYLALPLSSILKKYNAPKIIDYLSLDVEGAEEDIFKTFPFKKYKFLTLTIERPSRKLNRLLFNNNYVFVKNYKVDSFYIHKSIKDKINSKIENFEQLGKKNW